MFFDVSEYGGKSYNGTKINSSTDMCTYLLAEVNIGLVPGDAFGNDACVRMSFACSDANILEGVRRLKTGLMNLK